MSSAKTPGRQRRSGRCRSPANRENAVRKWELCGSTESCAPDDLSTNESVGVTRRACARSRHERPNSPRRVEPTAPSGVIGPPTSPPTMGLVMIEGLPAAHVECTGATSMGMAHPPPGVGAPPVPISVGSPPIGLFAERSSSGTRHRAVSQPRWIHAPPYRRRGMHAAPRRRSSRGSRREASQRHGRLCQESRAPAGRFHRLAPKVSEVHRAVRGAASVNHASRNDGSLHRVSPSMPRR